jgi:hypothetical protein
MKRNWSFSISNKCFPKHFIVKGNINNCPDCFGDGYTKDGMAKGFAICPTCYSEQDVPFGNWREL